MRVHLTYTKTVEVKSLAEASERVRCFIETGDLGAGCGSSLAPFTGGQIIDAAGTTIAHVSYNGRVWEGAEWEPNSKPLYDPYRL